MNQEEADQDDGMQFISSRTLLSLVSTKLERTSRKVTAVEHMVIVTLYTTTLLLPDRWTS